MTVFVPSYYQAFHCIADACRHSCCVGWEIGVDAASALRYRALPGPLGDRLRAALVTDADGDTVMHTDANGRCPFLHASGLCELITAYGDGILCQICADHPRFRTAYSDRTELGLGCCCEAVVPLVLGEPTPMRLLPLETDNAPLAPTAEETAFLRRRDHWFAIAANDSLTLEQRCERLLASVDIHRAPLSSRALYAVYAPLERLDNAFDSLLVRLLEESAPCPHETPLARLLTYFLFRHTRTAHEEGFARGGVAFAVHSVRLIAKLCGDRPFDALCDIVRAYCAEIEYSEDNLFTLLDTFD